MAAITEHNVTIFEDWVYNNYNNEGTWVTVDLSSYVGANVAYVRLYAQVTDMDTDGSEFAYIQIRQYGTNFKISANSNTSISYNETLKGEMHCWTDANGKIEYLINYDWWEAKKVKIKLTLEYSVT